MVNDNIIFILSQHYLRLIRIVFTYVRLINVEKMYCQDQIFIHTIDCDFISLHTFE